MIICFPPSLPLALSVVSMLLLSPQTMAEIRLSYFFFFLNFFLGLVPSNEASDPRMLANPDALIDTNNRDNYEMCFVKRETILKRPENMMSKSCKL